MFEQPYDASSWMYPAVRSLVAQDGVYCVDFDQCTTGLVCPGNGAPIKKRTRFATNSEAVYTRFAGKQCSCMRPHARCWGSKHGIQMSTFCQVYTAELCREVLGAVFGSLSDAAG